MTVVEPGHATVLGTTTTGAALVGADTVARAAEDAAMRDNLKICFIFENSNLYILPGFRFCQASFLWRLVLCELCMEGAFSRSLRPSIRVAPRSRVCVSGLVEGERRGPVPCFGGCDAFQVP